jgi:hypothetical protein|tara:strand:+ start:648 stop:950 length:303 start_codon:yes stop_codon:yes gene_type:complete
MSRYKTIDIFRTEEGRPYRTNAVYPFVPEDPEDIYIIASEEDRYDVLARKYYNDSSLWWIIASNNTDERAALKITPGTQIRIPANKDLALELYSQANKSR